MIFLFIDSQLSILLARLFFKIIDKCQTAVVWNIYKI
jgi:hypothetical protein